MYITISRSWGFFGFNIYVYTWEQRGCCSQSDTEVLEQILPVYLFYPDTDAYKMVIVVGSMVFEYPLAEHPTLNGAYFCSLLKIQMNRRHPYRPLHPCSLRN